MRKILLGALILQMMAAPALAADLRQFLKHCAYGTLIGAGAGVATLAFSDQPSEDLNNVARGASLGLYGGIAYGVYRLNTPDVQTYQEPSFGLMPLFEKNKIEGFKVETVVYNF
ncbi:hypothetical protein D3C87_256830 [compost metagenome]